MPEVDKKSLIKAAIEMAEDIGYRSITRNALASKAGVAMGSVNNHLGTMSQLRRTVIRHALRTENLAVVAQAVALKDPLVSKIDPDLKRRALASL